MTIWVMRDGRLVIKAEHLNKGQITVDFPTPMISRMEPYESPITGKEITSWRERDRDLKTSDSVDPRDIPKSAFEKRRKIVERNARSTGD